MADARRANFDLDKSVGLRNIDIQQEQLTAERSRGLRDIGQQRELGVEAAVNQALQRGIYHSGIRKENVAAVKTEAGEAEFDLKGDIQRALARLANQRRGIAGNQFIDADAGGGLDSFFGPLMEMINELMDNIPTYDPTDFRPPSFTMPNKPSTVGGPV